MPPRLEPPQTRAPSAWAKLQRGVYHDAPARLSRVRKYARALTKGR